VRCSASVSPTTRQLVFGSAQQIAGTVYGTIIVMATITAGAKTFGDRSWQLIAVVAATVVVLWIAHVYAHGLGESVRENRTLDLAELGEIAQREAAIVLAAIAPLLALTLGALDVLRAASAVWLALGIGVFALAVQGVRYARVEGLGTTPTAVVVTINVMLGLVIVGLKALTAH
jgi:hypothetical protein